MDGQNFFYVPPPSPPIPCAGLLQLPPGFRPPTHAFPGVVIGGDYTEVLKSSTPVTLYDGGIESHYITLHEDSTMKYRLKFDPLS